MNEELLRENSIPLTTKKWRGWLALAASVLAVFAIAHQTEDASFPTAARMLIWVLYVVLLIPYVLTELGRSFAKMHIVSDGITITLFGKTIRQISRHEIRLLAGVVYTRKSNTYKWIAVCPCSPEELAERMDQNGSMKAHLKDKWTERMAHKYLYRLGSSLRRDLGLPTKDIYLIEWSPERLALLQRVYQTPWTDLTEKKILDAERNA